MREILFRAKSINKYTGWVYGTPVFDENEQEYKLRPETHTAFHIKQETLGQYTGLKDKNGKKIFEGDIISANYYPFIDEDKQNYVGVVEWLDDLSSFEYILRCVNSNKRGISDGINEQLESNKDLILEDFEVIGNIWDNGDLINEN